jgi:hypothetical protein
LTPFYNRSLDIGENTKEFNYGLDLPRSLTSRVTRLNKVYNIIEEKTMKRRTCKILEIKKGGNFWINTFMEGSSKLVNGRELTITHFVGIWKL